MRRALCVITIAAIICLGIMGAVSIIPHTHGKDSDQSKHSSCPICQFNIQGFSATLTDFCCIIVLSLIFRCLLNISTLCNKLSYQLIPARGPPILI